MVFHLAGGRDDIVILIKNMKFTLGLSCHPKREYSAILHSMAMKVDIQLACAANLN